MILIDILFTILSLGMGALCVYLIDGILEKAIPCTSLRMALSVIIVVLLFVLAFCMAFSTSGHCYRVTLENGEVLEQVTDFRQPTRNNPYYTGIVNGERHVFRDIVSYSKTDKVFRLSDMK